FEGFDDFQRLVIDYGNRTAVAVGHVDVSTFGVVVYPQRPFTGWDGLNELAGLGIQHGNVLGGLVRHVEAVAFRVVVHVGWPLAMGGEFLEHLAGSAIHNHHLIIAHGGSIDDVVFFIDVMPGDGPTEVAI